MILVTGGTGFLGRYIVNELLSGGTTPVRILVRNEAHPVLKQWARAIAEGRLQVAVGDLLDAGCLPPAFAGATHVIHAAALVSFMQRDHVAMRRINAEGTRRVVDHALEAGVKKLVYVSSVAALGRPAQADGSAMIDETARWADSPYNSYYGYTKYLGEKHVARGVEEGLPAVQCNPTIILGAGDWRQGTAQFFPQLDRGFPFYPRGMNGFIGAADVARACRLLLQSDFGQAEKFVLVGENLFYRQFMGYVCQALGKREPRWPLPHGAATAAAWVLERAAALVGLQTPFNYRTFRTLGHISQYDSSLFQRTFNFSFTPIRQVVQAAAAQYLEDKQRKL